LPIKDLAVRFESGKDVLNAYWGYLSNGGLVIPDSDDLSVGEPVSLSVIIASASASYSLSGRVVRRDESRAVIAFAPGQPHDMLLTQALADADKVPARRSRRFRVELPAMVRDGRNGARPVTARVVDLSEHGCCIQLAGADDVASFAVDAPVEIAADPFEAAGRVVWARHNELGVVFTAADSAVRQFLQDRG
jgi:hypothetical protein